ncbi:MAG: zf-HC2 domain-containing protein [Nitrospirae bacterium]|nr:zf-HC2 domain-containing protein [Nitrospirota bacterium]
MMPTMLMGTCRETSQNIGDYLDRAMPLARRLRIRFHLSLCPDCRKWMAGLKATMAGIGLARALELSAQPPAELRAKIERIFTA